MGTYLKHDDLEYFVESREVPTTNEMNLRIGMRYGEDSTKMGIILDQTLTKEELRQFLTEIEKIYYYMW